MFKPNASKALADTIHAVVQQVQYNSPTQQLKLDCRILASTIIEALALHSINDLSTWIKWRMKTSVKPDQRKVSGLNPKSLNSQMNDVKNLRKISKRKISNKSKLDSYRTEIIYFSDNGYSLGEIQDWLRRYKRVQVNRSTIFRKLKVWGSNAKT